MAGKLTILLAGLALIPAACQSAPESEPSGNTVIYVAEDGSGAVVVDENGNPVDDPLMQGLADMLSKGLAPKELTPEEIFLRDEYDNATHIQSGVVCPVTWGAFERERVSIFKADGTDVGCNYLGPDGAIMTLYAYQRDIALEDEMAGLEDTIDMRNPGSRPDDMNEFGPSPDGFRYLTYTVAFRNTDGTAMKSGALLGEHRGWRLKARITYTARTANDVEYFAFMALRGWADRVGRTVPVPEKEDDKIVL